MQFRGTNIIEVPFYKTNYTIKFMKKIMVQNVQIKFFLLFITFFVHFRTAYGQKEVFIPKPINVKEYLQASTEAFYFIKKRAAIGIYQYRVTPQGNVDSVLCLGNLGKLADSVQIIAYKKYKFEKFSNKIKPIWFQEKFYCANKIFNTHGPVPHDYDCIMDQIELTKTIYEQELIEHFGYKFQNIYNGERKLVKDKKKKYYFLKNNIIYIEPTMSTSIN